MTGPQLWHYTCEHGRRLIGEHGYLQPATSLVGLDRARLLPWWGDLVWLTDLAYPNRDALGLTMTRIACDRTAHRYRVTDADWPRWWIDARRVMPPHWIAALEAEPGVRPRHWFVSALDVPVELAPL